MEYSEDQVRGTDTSDSSLHDYVHHHDAHNLHLEPICTIKHATILWMQSVQADIDMHT